jgi:hypothetical protein
MLGRWSSCHCRALYYGSKALGIWNFTVTDLPKDFLLGAVEVESSRCCHSSGNLKDDFITDTTHSVIHRSHHATKVTWNSETDETSTVEWRVSVHLAVQFKCSGRAEPLVLDASPAFFRCDVEEAAVRFYQLTKLIHASLHPRRCSLIGDKLLVDRRLLFIAIIARWEIVQRRRVSE